MTNDCIFCRIARGDLGTEFLVEGAEWVAFADLSPQAPTHVLVVPRAHVESLDDLPEGDLAGRLLHACREVAAATGIETGYRVLTNVGRDGGQEVPHLHFHVLGGRRMGWPPG